MAANLAPGRAASLCGRHFRAIGMYASAPGGAVAWRRPLGGAPFMQESVRPFRSSTALSALQAGIVGLPNVGKSTLFNAIVENGKAQVRTRGRRRCNSSNRIQRNCGRDWPFCGIRIPPIHALHSTQQFGDACLMFHHLFSAQPCDARQQSRWAPVALAAPPPHTHTNSCRRRLLLYKPVSRGLSNDRSAFLWL